MLNAKAVMGLVVFVLVGLLLSTNAYSAISYLGTLSSTNDTLTTGTVFHVDAAGNAFNDSYQFNIDSSMTGDISANASEINFDLGFVPVDITNLTLHIFGAGFDKTWTDGNNNGVISILDSLTIGTLYSMDISGVLNTGVGAYTASVGGSPVPIPPAVFLFGSAILGLIVVGRRKQV